MTSAICRHGIVRVSNSDPVLPEPALSSSLSGSACSEFIPSLPFVLLLKSLYTLSFGIQYGGQLLDDADQNAMDGLKADAQ